MENFAKNTVIVIFAPTASGKTALTRELFSPSGSHFIFKGEVISADSQSVYKGMDIGTAKPDKVLQSQIPHHLIDILPPSKQFNVSDFVDMADELCTSLLSKQIVPVVCGGTGFYIRNFLYGVPKTPQSDEVLRNSLKNRLTKEGNLSLYKELQKVDPLSAQKIHVNDAYRICRALEVYYLSGKTRGEFIQEEKVLRKKFNFIFIVLKPPREQLYERIRNRVDLMFEQGLYDEVLNLKKMGYTKDSPGLKAIGYSEWFENSNVDVIREEIKHHSTKYAKKQYTYIKDIPGSHIIEYDFEKNDCVEKVFELLTKVYNSVII